MRDSLRFQPLIGTKCCDVHSRDLEFVTIGECEDLFKSEDISSDKVNHD